MIKVICLTPVRNEAWILDKFLQATSLWADHIIISDQMSTDGSREIASQYPKVILIENNTQVDFSEYGLRKPLIDEARKIKGPRLLISLDADEVFTPNFNSPEWTTIKKLSPGTIIKFPWINIYPDFKLCWDAGNKFSVGYIDDGAEFKTGLIHDSRLFDISSTTSKVLVANQIKILHLQYTDWNRMEMKHLWYQCFEKINFPEKSSIDIYRRYHHMYVIPKENLLPISNEWIEGYNLLDVDITTVISEQMLSWEETILNYFEQYGISFFKRLDIWKVDWVNIAKKWDWKNSESFFDPRSKFDKRLQKWLYTSQGKQDQRKYRRIDRLFKIIFKY
jgi:hypothetical protein